MAGMKYSGLARVVDLAAAGALAAAVAYAIISLTGIAAWAATAALASFATTLVAMGRIDDSPRLPLAAFSPVPVEAAAADPLPELLLTELTELLLDEPVDDDALLLDDQLVEPGENSRVIRLFDPRSLPTAGELHHRIEGHLHRSRSSADATKELHRALSDLRSALR